MVERQLRERAPTVARPDDQQIGAISFESLIEVLDQGVVVVRRDGSVKYINPAGLQVYGLQSQEEATDFGKQTMSLRWYDGDGNPLRLDQLPLVETFRTGVPFSRQVFGTDLPNGERRWMVASARLTRPDAPTETDVLVSFADITEERARLERLVYLANHDPMTGLPNRAFVLRKITEALEPANCMRLHAVLFVDLDDLKRTNDTLGHEAGDDLLTAAAARLQQAVGPAGVVGRLGGDEFVLLIFDGDEEIDELVDRLEYLLADPVVPVRASVGVVEVTSGDARSAEEILRDADRAMYQAKRAGRGV
jgi:diguanylate cyclase (GGDEF)-like protein